MSKQVNIGQFIGGGLLTVAILSGVSYLVPPKNVYPDKNLTPGKADTLLLKDLTRLYNGKTYSQSHRNVSNKTAVQVYKDYGVDKKSGVYEVDHFYPLCAGGSNDPENLWIQYEHVYWFGTDYGFRAKDRLEAYVCREIKAGRLDPKYAFKRITEDWVKYYNEIYTVEGFPSVSNYDIIH